MESDALGAVLWGSEMSGVKLKGLTITGTRRGGGTEGKKKVLNIELSSQERNEE